MNISKSKACLDKRRDDALAAIVKQIPYADFLGVHFQRQGGQLTAVMPFGDDLVGNPLPPALHGGATAAFFELASTVVLTWSRSWAAIEDGTFMQSAGEKILLPTTIDFTMDYMRPGFSRTAYAQVRINRAGRRYGSVHVEGWQDDRDRVFAQATGHFVMPSIRDE